MILVYERRMMSIERAIKELSVQYLESEEIKEAKRIAIKALSAFEREDGELIENIKNEFIARYPKNYVGDPELGGCACTFSLNTVLDILDEYKKEN